MSSSFRTTTCRVSGATSIVDRQFAAGLGLATYFVAVGDTLARDVGDFHLGNSEGPAQAMATLEATLRAEDWFFSRIREKIAEVIALDDLQMLPSANWNDHILHFAQFLYFLRALDCTSPAQIAAFIDNHNQMIERELADPKGNRKLRELEKARFGPQRKNKVTESIRHLGRPVFAISEYGHLLIDYMSPKTTENLIEDLRRARLLVNVEDGSINADSRRILFASTGFLEETYERSLLVQRRLIAATIDPGEFARIRNI